MSILDISKTWMYEFWYDYVKPKYQDKAKLCCMETDSFSIHISTKDFYEYFANDAKGWFGTSNYDNNRPLPIGKSKRVIGLFKDKLGGKIMIEFVMLTAKTYACLMDDDTEYKKAKGTKQSVMEKRHVWNYKDCLCSHKIILKSQERFKSDYHNGYTEEINKIALSSNDDKRSQTFDKIMYPYGTNAFKVCESEMLSKIQMIKLDDYANENKTKHNLKWPFILDHPYRILKIGGSGSGKRNALLNLINNQPDIDKIYLYAKEPYEVNTNF